MTTEQRERAIKLMRHAARMISEVPGLDAWAKWHDCTRQDLTSMANALEERPINPVNTRVCCWCRPRHVIEVGDVGGGVTHGLCERALKRELDELEKTP